MVTSFSYDNNGNLVSRKVGDVEKSFEYDSMNRVTKEFIAGALTASYTYDAAGNISSVTDGLGNQTKYIRTKGGDIAAVIDPLGNVTRYRYDKAHRLMNIVQGVGTEAEDINLELLEDAEEVLKLNKKHNSIRITSYARDVLGRVTSVTDSLGNVESYEYDRKGHIKAKTDMDGNRTKITRTHLGDISRITYGDGEDIEYSYNALGQLKAIKDSLGLTKIDRDILGRERSITDHKGRSISYEYDDAGNRTGIRYANGKNVRYIYDDRGLLTDIEVTGIDGAAPKMKSSSAPASLSSSPVPASVKATPAVSLSYDSYGRITSKTVGPAETAYTYDKCGHLASLANKKNGIVLDSYAYSYDQIGNLVASRQKREGMPEATGNYEYGYDEIGRLNRVVKDGRQLRSYTYDAFGNRTILDEAGAKTEYLYNKANQLMRADTPHGTTIFEYDKRGNAIHKSTEGVSKTVSVSYTYGANNRLIQAVKNTDGESLTARYAYNGLGMRVSRATDTGSVDYILDQTKMYNNLLESIQVDDLGSMENPSKSEDFIWLGNELVKAAETPILSGRLGTPERAAGASEHSLGYDEFGIPEVAKIPETTKLPEIVGELPLGFTGYMRDDISDTLFAQAREYMPEIGRFMGRDILKGRVEQPRSLNEYAYCHNDPVGFVDLNGMDAILVNKEIEGVSGIEHMGGFFQDSDSKWYYFYWGDTVKVKKVDDNFNGSKSDVTAYLKRKDAMGVDNKEYRDAVYVKGDFSKSVEEGQRLQEFYDKNYKKYEGEKKCPNRSYNLLTRNCTQETMHLFMKGKLESGESVKAFLNRRGYKEASVLPNINMHIMQVYFGNSAVNKEEYYEQISLD